MTLSPMYDVNPDIYGNYLSLNVNSNDNSISLELAVSSAHFYNIEEEEALSIANEIVNTVNKNWIHVAEKYNISHSQIEYMRPAFDKIK